MPSGTRKTEFDSEAVTELLNQLHRLHSTQVQLIDKHHLIERERKKVHAEITHARQRLAILRGERMGGRPIATYIIDSLQTRVQAAIELEPERHWTPKDLADVLDSRRPLVASTLSNLNGFGRVQRISRGVYKATTNWPRPLPEENVKQRRGPLVDRALEVINADPKVAWSAKRLIERGIAKTINQARDLLTDLHAKGKIQRLNRGSYVSLVSTNEPKKAKRDALRDRAQKRREWNENWRSPNPDE